MSKSTNPYRLRDTTLLTGWLFADLLLGLMMIFLVSVPRIPPVQPPPPVLIVNPTSLDPNNPHCTGGTDNPQCTVTLQEASGSQGSMTWAVNSDMVDSNTSSTIKYTPASGTLTPGATIQVQISAIPCQNGSFTFTGSRGANSQTIRWHCTPKHTRLDTNYHRLKLPNVDYNGLLSGSQSAINDVRNRVSSQIPSGALVGFAIVYDGTPNTTNDIDIADNVDEKVYQVLRTLTAFQRSSYYDQSPLFTLNGDHALVQIDVFYFTTQ